MCVCVRACVCACVRACVSSLGIACALYISSLGYSCPELYNPADFFVFTLAIVPGKEEECREKVGVSKHDFEFVFWN